MQKNGLLMTFIFHCVFKPLGTSIFCVQTLLVLCKSFSNFFKTMFPQTWSYSAQMINCPVRDIPKLYSSFLSIALQCMLFGNTNSCI